MTKKTDKNILKDQIKDTELYVRTARDDFIDHSNVFLGAIYVLRCQGNITLETADYLERQIKSLDTQSKKIEIEYYKLKDITEKGLK